jgi:hypothetical protein
MLGTQSKVAAAGITSGCGGDNFCPEKYVERAQMAVFVEDAVAWPGNAFLGALTGTLFDNVPITHWAVDYIEELANDGISGGRTESLFCPTKQVTRAQMAVFIVAAFGL